MEEGRSKLTMPLADILVRYIKKEYSDLAPRIISAVELAVKNSRNQYQDVTRALEPFLKDKTKILVDKLFMFRKKRCREWSNCTLEFCLFAHDESAIPKRQNIDLDRSKRQKENNEVVFNKVDESKYDTEQLSIYASKFGTVTSIKRLNKGKYLVTFDSPISAKKLVDSLEYVLDDSEIMKFYNLLNTVQDFGYNETNQSGYNTNINTYTVNTSKVSSDTISCSRSVIEAMFIEQKELLDNLSVSFDNLMFISLKSVTMKIKNYILSNSNFSSTNNVDNDDKNVDNTFYYNMLLDS